MHKREIEQNIRSIISREPWLLHQVDFSDGYVTLALSVTTDMRLEYVSLALGTKAIPVMHLDNSDPLMETWICIIEPGDVHALQ